MAWDDGKPLKHVNVALVSSVVYKLTVYAIRMMYRIMRPIPSPRAVWAKIRAILEFRLAESAFPTRFASRVCMEYTRAAIPKGRQQQSMVKME